MSSNDSALDLPKSMKNLFTLLSGSLNLKSQQFIATELERNTKQLTFGLLYYQKHNPNEDSLEELSKKQSLDSFPVELMAKTSLLLDLRANECKELFNSYLMYEFKGTPEMVKQLFTNEKQVKQLLHELYQYYYCERIFSLFCLKQILSHWKQSSQHVYQQIFHSFLERIDTNNQLFPKLMKQLVYLNETPIPSRLTNGPYFSESLAKEWVNNNLKEQIEILELLLLYFKEFETSIDNIIELLTLFKSNGFASKFTHFNTIDCEYIGEEVFRFIGFLESILIVECLDLKWLYECHQQDIECQLIKEQNSRQLKELDKIILNLNCSCVEHSPIFMSWMIVRSWELPEFDVNDGQHIVTQLGSNALQLNIFSYLEKCLSLSQTIALNGTVVSDLIYRSIGDLLSVTFNVYNIELLGHSIPALNHLCIKLFKNNYIANDLFKHGLDSELGLIISAALSNFPYKMNPVLSFCQSLSETDNCKQVFEKLSILSNLTSLTEPFDSSLATCAPTQHDSIYVLIRDKMLYRNFELIIKKDTKGLLKIVNNNRVVEWKDINIDGFKLIYHRFLEQHELVSRGQLYSVSDIVITEMSQITAICSNLIKHNCYQHISSFHKLIKLCFETYELFSSLENPFRLFMASILELSASVLKGRFDFMNATTVWHIITGKRFMPYMIGLTSDLKEIMSGNDTNTSILGRLIATEECIRGRYELCIAFLQLIAEVVKKPVLKEDNNLMASLVFIIQEVFPSHFFWNFINQNDFFKIGRLCFEIFNTILSKTDKNSNRTKIEQICISALMEANAAQTLLNVIKSGETTVRNVILSAGNDNSLTNDDQIIIVQKSLSVLNYLLVLHTNPTNHSSVVETALFSSQSKPNMLLILSHYVIQRYDTHLATLAVQLLKQLAKRFPMSMLACLGSDAEAMRDHFLYRLEEVCEDLNLKIALLNFLSACVERQPGLMEMFLNVDKHNDNNTTGCLQTVLEILTEKREAKYFCPFELHLASLKFLYTFWVGPHLLAIDSLKKTSNVWTLITFPLFEESTFDDILCVYILRILAREVFYVKTLERDKFDCDLENKFKIMKESDRLAKLSTHIRQVFNTTNQIKEDSRLLLNAWKDFLVSIARFDPFAITNELKYKISNDIIECLLNQLNEDNCKQIDNNIITSLSDVLLILLVKWKETCIESEDDWNSRIERLIKCVDKWKDYLAFSAINTIESSIIKYLELFQNGFNSSEWIVYSSKLLNQSLRIIEKQIKRSEKHLEMEFKLSVTSISLLQMLVNQNSFRASVWIQILRTNFVIESVINLLIYLIENRIGVELSVHIMSLLVELSSIPISGETLYTIGFVDNLCVSLQNTYNTSHESVLKSKSTVNWINVFHLSIQLIVNLVNHLRHHFVDIAITFVAIHLDHLIEILTKLRTSPNTNDIRESILIATLCHSISRYNQIWRRSHLFSFQRIQDEILKTSNSVIAFLIRPNFLSYLMQNPLTSTAATVVIPSDLTPKKVSPTSGFESKTGLRKSISWESDFMNHSLDTTVLNSLFTFQIFSIAFLQNVSPNILELLEKQGFEDNKWELIINTSFSSPNIDPNLTLSFGSLINCIQMCIKTLNRSERSSESENSKAISHSFSEFVPYIFEMSLSFIVSQAMVAQMSLAISEVDKQIIVREIKSELSTILSNAGIRQSRRSSQSFALLSPKYPISGLIERSFVKFLLQFVEKITQ